MELDQRTQNIGAAIVAVVMVVAIALASGLGPFAKTSPFEGKLTAVQQAQLERVEISSLRLIDESSTVQTEVAGFKDACAQLDPTVPLLAAYAQLCPPMEQMAQLVSLAPERCGADAVGPCIRVFKRLGRQFEALAIQGPVVDAELRKLITDEECLSEIGLTPQDAIAFRSAGQAATQMAEGIRLGDEAAFRAASDAFDAALRSGQERGQQDQDATADEKIAHFRKACGLKATA